MKLGMADLLEQTPVSGDGGGRRVSHDVSLIPKKKIRKERLLDKESLRF